jgi:hypothetical protein
MTSNTLTIATWNQQRGAKKRLKTIEKRLEKHNIQYLLMQEVGQTPYNPNINRASRYHHHYTIPPDEEIQAKKKHKSKKSHTSHIERQTRTLGTLTNKNYTPFTNTKDDKIAQYQLHDIDTCEGKITVLHIYIPPNDNQQTYIDNIEKLLKSLYHKGIYPIIGGDFNLTENEHTDTYRNYQVTDDQPHTTHTFLHNLEQAGYVNAHTACNGNKSGFTWQRITYTDQGTPRIIKKRIDHWYVPTYLQHKILACEVIGTPQNTDDNKWWESWHHNNNNSDHGMLKLTLNIQLHDTPPPNTTPLPTREIFIIPRKNSPRWHKFLQTVTITEEIKQAVTQLQSLLTTDDIPSPSAAQQINHTVTLATLEIQRGMTAAFKTKTIDPNSTPESQVNPYLDHNIKRLQKQHNNLNRVIGTLSQISNKRSKKMHRPHNAPTPEAKKIQQKLLRKITKCNKSDIAQEMDLHKIDSTNTEQWLLKARQVRNAISLEINQRASQITTESISKVMSELTDAQLKDFNVIFKRINRRTRAHHITSIIDPDKTTITLVNTGDEVKRIISKFWQSTFTHKPQPTHTDPTPSFPPEPTYPDTTLNDMSVLDITDSIQDSPNNSSAGGDNIQAEIYKILPNDWNNIWKTIFNACNRTRDIPSMWKTGRIFLLPKEGNQHQPSNYRPICLLPVLYKVYSRILTKRITEFTTKNSTIHPQQNGWRPGADITTNTFILIEIIKKSIRKHTDLHIIFIDIAKAFDTAQFWAIQQRMIEHGFSTNTAELIYNSLQGMQCDIITGYGTTEPITIQSGVRQGDPISPILYSIFINPLIQTIAQLPGATIHKNNISILAYADDIVLISESEAGIELLYNTIKAFAKYNQLNINAGKSGYAFIHKTQFSPEWNGTAITKLGNNTPYKYLGFHINLQLDWTTQLNLIAKHTNEWSQTILNKKFTTNQKILLLNTIPIAYIKFYSQVINIPPGTLKAWDEGLCQKLNTNTGIDSNSDNAYWWLKRKLNNINIEYRATQIATMHRSLNSPTITARLLTPHSGCFQSHSQHLRDTGYTYLPHTTPPPHNSPNTPITNIPPTTDDNVLQYNYLNDNTLPTIPTPPATPTHVPNPATNATTTATDILDMYNLTPIQPSHMDQYDNYALVWTDGSVKDDITKSAVYFNKKNPHNTVITVPGQPISQVAEAHGIELALYLTPTNTSLIIFTDSKSTIDAIMNFKSWSHKRKQQSPILSCLTRITNQLALRTSHHTTTNFEHVPSHIQTKYNAAKKQGRQAYKKHLNKIAKYKRHFGELWQIVINGNEKADELFTTQESTLPTHTHLPHHTRYTLQNKDHNTLEGSPLRITKNILQERIRTKWHTGSTERTKAEKNDNIHPNLPWITSPKLQDTAHLADWWHKVEQKLISSVSKYHRTWTNLRGAANTDPFFSKYGEYVFNDSKCTLCPGKHTDNFMHTMTSCNAGKQHDDTLLHEINKIIQEHNPQWPPNYPLWFDTPTIHKNAMFQKFNTAYGLIGYLPANINKLLKKAGICTDKIIKGTIDKIDQATKINRFNKWHNKWQIWHDKHNTDSIKRKIHAELQDVPFYKHTKKNCTPVTHAQPIIEQEYEVDKVMAHRHDNTNNLEYLVRWAGYAESDNTWEPESHLTDNPSVTEYWTIHKEQISTNPPSTYMPDPTPDTNNAIDLTTTNTNDTWEFEDIVSHRKCTNGEFEYHIKWYNCPHSENTWEPSNHIVQAEVIHKYWARHNQKRKLEEDAIIRYRNNTSLSYKKRRTKRNRKRTSTLRQTTLQETLNKKTKAPQQHTNTYTNNNHNNNNNNSSAPSPPTASPQPSAQSNGTATSPSPASPQPAAQTKRKRTITLDIDPYEFLLPESDSDSEDETYKTPKQLYTKKSKHKHKPP